MILKDCQHVPCQVFIVYRYAIEFVLNVHVNIVVLRFQCSVESIVVSFYDRREIVRALAQGEHVHAR